MASRVATRNSNRSKPEARENHDRHKQLLGSCTPAYLRCVIMNATVRGYHAQDRDV
jgi:hypothetical protein